MCATLMLLRWNMSGYRELAIIILGSTKDKVSQRVRYWDWARDSHLPNVVMQPTIELSVPGMGPGDKDTLTLDHNPLYSYKFTSDYAIKTIQKKLNWDNSSAWEETKRCPETSGVSNQEISGHRFVSFQLTTRPWEQHPA